jgi:hypothetical protein
MFPAAFVHEPEAQPAAPAPGPVQRAIAAATDARAGVVVGTREAAMRDDVVNRARDLMCGTLATLEFRRLRGEDDLGAGWLARPDPTHSRGWFISWVTDDLFFHGVAMARATARDSDGQVNALQWMPYTQVIPTVDGTGVSWHQGWYPDPRWPTDSYDVVDVPLDDLVVFESPLSGVLAGGTRVLSTAARLDDAADRFAAAEVPAGWLEQTAGEDLDRDEARAQVEQWIATRRELTVGWLNQSVAYHESQMDPSRLQLVEGRAYQDAATARLCNVPNFAVGVGVPNDSMTYKTAFTARLDLIDFGLAPLLACWTQTLTDLAPRGQSVEWDLEPFLRSSVLAGLVPAEAAAAAGAAKGAP